MPSLQEQFQQHAKDDAERFDELREMLERIDAKLEPLVQVYDGVLFSKKFIVGLSSVVIAIGAIGAGVIWIINNAIHK